MIKEIWAKLDPRQRTFAACCAAALAVIALLALVVFPLWDGRTKMKKSIAANSGKLAQVEKIDADFAVADAQISRIKSAVITRRADFTLFSYLEKKAVAAGVKGSIRQMNTLQGARSPSFEETLIDLRLEKITVKQLADFLYEVESPAELIRIKRITVDKMKESPDYLSAQLLIASYMPVSMPDSGLRGRP